MKPSSYCEELPLNTLDMTDLLMQFRVMKALGYHSLFDENFRRELRNPFRRVLYYKLVAAEDSSDFRILSRILKGAADRIGFYSNPELAKHVLQREEQEQLKDPKVAKEIVDEYAAKYEEAQRNYVPMDAVTLKAVQEQLKR